MTVSRVINGEASVRDQTREAVNRAIEELGYSPNKAARSLASAKQTRIALLYSNPSSSFLSPMLIGVLDQARQSDTQVVVIECKPGPDAVGVIEEMSLEGIDGIILAPPLCDSPSAFKSVKHLEIPAVTIGSSHEEHHISALRIDDYSAARQMTQRLIDLGHEHIAFIIGKLEQSASRVRLSGFQDAMREAGLELPSNMLIQGEFSYRSGFECAEALLSLDPRPTAIFCSNDDMAAGAIAAAHRCHLDVPEDLSICGFDDTMLATTVWPEITTVRQPISEMSRIAIQLLERNIRQIQADGQHVQEHLVLDHELKPRGSDSAPQQS